MPPYHQILWSEGLFLTQHHFQQFDSYIAGERAFLLRALVPFAWGLSHLAIDETAVENRTLTVGEVEGIWPDGTAVRAPSVDDLPGGRPFESLFAPTARVLPVYLGLPRLRPGTAGVQMESEKTHAPTRYARAFAHVPDAVTGEHEREIPYLKKKLVLLFGGEDLEGYDVLKIAEVERSPEGKTRLRPSYVPPLVSVHSSKYLTTELRGLLETASAKSESLAEQVRQRTPTLTEFSTSDFPNFLKLHTVNAYIPLLSQWHTHPRAHPLGLFQLLAAFAGHLCGFKVGEHPRNLPAYDHDNLEGSFAPLVVKLRELLEAVVEARFVRIPLAQRDTSRFDGPIEDVSLFERSEFYLGVGADLSESKIASEFPRHAKVISPDKMERLIGGNLPGANLIFVQLPPASVPRKAGMVYFRIDPRGDRWDYIKKAREIAIYAPPDEFPDWTVECLAVER